MQPSSQPSSRPTTLVRTRITFSMRQVIKGVSQSDFNTYALSAFKRTLVRIIPGLEMGDITIDSVGAYVRRLRGDVGHIALG